MKINKIIFAVTALVAMSVCALTMANENSGRKPAQKRSASAPVRQRGTPAGHNRIITQPDRQHEGKTIEVVHPVINDHRPLASIHNDRTIIHVTNINRFPPGHIEHRWDHWHRDWGVYWRFADWSRISQVTCEATNAATAELFPVTGYQRDYPGAWNNDIANVLVENAMDSCYADAEQNNGDPAQCTMVSWECQYIPLP